MTGPTLRLTRIAAIALLLVLSAGCSGDGGSSEVGSSDTTAPSNQPTADTAEGAPSSTDGSEPSTSPATEQPPFVVGREPNPLPITFTPESDRATTATIGSAGGTLSATGSDGTEYRLIIEPGALAGDEDITVAPIEVNTSPLEDASVFGLTMEPDGLAFLKPARLEISAPPDATLDLIGFQASGTGDGFAGAVVERADLVVLRISHFSAGGYVAARDAEIARIFDEYTPGTREGQYVQEIAVINRRVSDPAARADSLGNVFSEWFDAIAEDVQSATSPSEVEDLLGEYIHARDLYQLMIDWEAIPEEFDKVVRAAAAAISSTAREFFDAAGRQCIEDGDVDWFFDMLKWYLVIDYLARDTRDWSALDGLALTLGDCARFRIEFESNVTIEGLSAYVAGDVTLRLDTDLETELATNQFTYPAIEAEFGGSAVVQTLDCITSVQTDSTATLPFSFNIGQTATGEFRIPEVQIRFHPPNWNCGRDMGAVFWLPYFHEVFKARSMGDGFYVFRPGLSSKSGVWAEETGLGNVQAGEGRAQVDFVVRLVHEPGGS